MDRDLKKVRKTVDYLRNPHPSGSVERSAHPSNLIAVINTTGTSYFQHQPLRDVVVVSLGVELAADAWLEDWNRLRARGEVPNRIEAIELRTDPRVGGFFTHQPAQAEVEIRREISSDGREEIHVEITNFISPSILERLRQQSGILTPQITDWRSMVDSVMIDPDYDGKVFNIALADVPEKKDEMVSGSYRLPAPDGERTVAVKITDMLGEEVILIQRD